MNIDWGKPGWIMVGMWLFGAVMVAIVGPPLYALVFLAFACLWAYFTYSDPKGH